MANGKVASREARIPGKYGICASNRIDTVTEQIAAGALTGRGKALKSKAHCLLPKRVASSEAIVAGPARSFDAELRAPASHASSSGVLEWGVPQGLRGLFRAGA